MIQMIQFTGSGEVVVADFDTMTCTVPLHHAELDEPLEDYQLDHELEPISEQDYTVIRVLRHDR